MLSKVTAKDVYSLLGMILLVSFQTIIFYLSCQIYSNRLDELWCYSVFGLVRFSSRRLRSRGPRGGLARTQQLLPAPRVLAAPCSQRTPLANILYMISFSSASKSESCVVVGASYSCDDVQW